MKAVYMIFNTAKTKATEDRQFSHISKEKNKQINIFMEITLEAYKLI